MDFIPLSVEYRRGAHAIFIDRQLSEHTVQKYGTRQLRTSDATQPTSITCNDYPDVCCESVSSGATTCTFDEMRRLS